MEQVKPEVIGYRQIEFMGNAMSTVPAYEMSGAKMIAVSRSDFDLTWHKSKFRPVYKKD